MEVDFALTGIASLAWSVGADVTISGICRLACIPRLVKHQLRLVVVKCLLHSGSWTRLDRTLVDPCISVIYASTRAASSVSSP